jgi:hypothetical protein
MYVRATLQRMPFVIKDSNALLINPFLTTHVSRGQSLLVDHIFEISAPAIVDLPQDDFVFIHFGRGDVIVLQFPLLPNAVVVTVDDVVNHGAISISDGGEEESPVATALGVVLPLEVVGVINV